MMLTLHAIFYFFSFMTLVSALMVVIARNPVHAALFLVLTFVSMAGIWILLHAEFLALILVLVYVGAVMTLFLFVVMMLSINGTLKKETFVRYLPFSILIIFMMIVVIAMMGVPDQFGIASEGSSFKSSDYNNLANLGLVLYTDYVYPFETAAVLLLTAIISAICLTHRPSGKRKVQNQVAVKRSDRVRLIKSDRGEKT